MNAEILGAILSWPTAVIVTALVALAFILLFRKQLAGVLERLIELRAARTKEGMEFAIKGAEEPLTAREVEEEEKAPKETKEAAKERKAPEIVDPYFKALDALLEKDFETYEKIYEQIDWGG